MSFDYMEDAPCGFVSFQETGRILRINNTLLEYLRYSPAEMEGKTVEQLLTIPSRIFYQTHFYPLLKLHGKAEEIFLTLVTRDNTDIPVLANAVKRYQSDSFVIDCVFIPVAQRGKYEEHLLQARKTAEDALHKNQELINAKQELELHKEELDRKVSMLEQKNVELLQVNKVISHDLQEPIRKILSFADILLRDSQNILPPKGLSAIDRITYSGHRMRQIVLNLEKFISFETNEKELEVVDLNKVIRKALEELKEVLSKREINIDAEDMPLIEGYEEQLVFLFRHLMENSIKFSHPGEGTSIKISCDLIQDNSFKATKGKFKYIDFVKITFADNGIGFENTYKDYIFQILKKLHNDKEDLGFGLAFCKKIVENHFGSISAESGAGQGATFTILLPLKQQL